MRDDRRRLPPAQAMVLEPQRREDRRTRAERVERTAHVVHITGLDQLGRPNGTARIRLCFEDDDPPTVVSEQIGGDEAVRARADDDRIDCVCDHESSPLTSRCSTIAADQNLRALQHMKIVVLADTHLADSVSSRLPAPAWKLLRSADVIMHAGDITGRGVP